MPLQVSIVTPEREVWTGEATFVLTRAEGGDIGILPGHSPFLGSLHHARLSVETEEGRVFVAVHGGFVEVSSDQVTVLTERAEVAEEIDVDRVRRQIERLRRELQTEDTAQKRAALQRAETRLQTLTEAGLERP
jgi:F-type H+-transporting ATPase subunit epsilon